MAPSRRLRPPVTVPNRDEDAELRQEIWERLTAELAAHDRRRGVPPSLQQAIDDFAWSCRTNGDSPERVLLTLKAIIAQAEAARPEHLQADPADRRRASETLVALCIECYYRDR